MLGKGSRRTVERDGKTVEFLPALQDPGDDQFSHLEFALKREGLHLELLRKVLPMIEAGEITSYVKSRPTGRYARICWWLFEAFTNSKLDLPDLSTGNYVDLLDSTVYVTRGARREKRQRVNVNLLGSVEFSPMVRWAGLGTWDERELKARCAQIMGEYPPAVFQRAVRYLYAKESKSSHEIERETPDQKRAQTFINLLEQAWIRSFLKKEPLVELQRAIVEPRYANNGWRSEKGEQVYVGETLGPGFERVHYIAPKPEDLDDLMDKFLEMSRQITNRRVRIAGTSVTHVMRSEVPTLISAAVISFVFNFLHPFSDGNGRIHRFLLHHVLARNGFGPEGIILPVSAVILNRPREYDEALENFSKPLMARVEYSMDDRHRVNVLNETKDFYRYIDCTKLAAITIDFIRETIESELPTELRYLSNYDDIRSKMRDIVDLPDRIADLFIKLCRQNNGFLSKKKRNLDEFSPLSDEEIEALEHVVRDGMGMNL